MCCIPVEKPHAVMVPFPAQGHITPMMKVAKLLHSNGFYVTFVNTEYNHRRLVRSRGPDAFVNSSMDDLTNGYLDTPIEVIPGMHNMRLRDFPSFIRTTDPNDVMLQFLLRETGRTARASAVILNTFDALERPVLDAMSSITPPLYTIGPLHLLTNQLLPPGGRLSSMGSSLWKEETSYSEWLRGRPAGSVVYVNFGSITVMTNEQLVEFAWGLADSNRDFLWVIRPDLVRGNAAVLPEEFLAATEERGMLASWCPQEEVLTHPAIGGYLTHCGWNSTMESISAGVPVICWPFFAEQQTNCRYLCAEWGVGMEIDSDVRSADVTVLIKELMEGEKGAGMRKKVGEWKEDAVRATKPGGSSLDNFERLVKELLLPSKA